MVVLKTGDIIKINFSPTNGREQSGKRPAMIVSVSLLHTVGKMVWAVPITTDVSNFPLHTNLSTKKGVISGTVLCEHIRSFDPDAREFELVDEATPETIKKCKAIIESIIYYPK